MSVAVSECLSITPTHKQELDEAEVVRLKISLRSCERIPHSFLLPKSCKPEFFLENFPDSGILKMDDEHFQSRKTYNKLLLDVEFYKQFELFKYLLILQSDACLIKDVKNIIRKGFSYVGPPWVDSKRIQVLLGRMFEDSKKLRHLKATEISVGNGGLSLRKIQDVTMALESLKRKSWNASLLSGEYNEDIVISYILKKQGFLLPDETEARMWFIEKHAKEMTLETALQLYGFHAMSRFNPNLEKQILRLKETEF